MAGNSLNVAMRIISSFSLLKKKISAGARTVSQAADYLSEEDAGDLKRPSGIWKKMDGATSLENR